MMVPIMSGRGRKRLRLHIGVAALTDGSLVLVEGTEGNFVAENAGQREFVVGKLTSDGVVDWSWQVTYRCRKIYLGPDMLRYSLKCSSIVLR